MKSEMMNIRFAVTALLFLGLVPRNVFAQESGFKYDYVSDFSEGLAMVMLDGKCGFINRTGKEVIPLEYSYARDFHNGVAIVSITDSGEPIVLDEPYGRGIQDDFG